MGKGYNNYMTKKPFHPGSKANIKRTWMAEQRTENEKKKQEELKTQYEKEQDLYNNKALLSTECKDKLELNFMYEAPPGAKRERQKEDDEPEYKFEWQRKYNAPREDYAKGNADIRDQPFGIPVRNVRCIKCHKWGHINTDRECPMFSQSSASSMPTTSMDPLELMRQMREDGYNIKASALGHHVNLKQSNQELVASEESDPEMDFLKSLSSKQKRKLLKKLNKLSKKQSKKDERKKKKDKKQETSDSESDEPKSKKKKKNKTQARWSSSDSESEDSIRQQKVRKKETKKSKDAKNESEAKKKQILKKRTRRDSSSDSSDSEDSRTPSPKHKKPKEPSEHKEKHVKLAKSAIKPNDEPSTSKVKESKDSDESKTSKNEPVKQIRDACKEPSKSPLHPDGFSHRHPQSSKGARRETLSEKFHNEFRNTHRHRRSPSVKHKYRK